MTMWAWPAGVGGEPCCRRGSAGGRGFLPDLRDGEGGGAQGRHSDQEFGPTCGGGPPRSGKNERGGGGRKARMRVGVVRSMAIWLIRGMWWEMKVSWPQVARILSVDLVSMKV